MDHATLHFTLSAVTVVLTASVAAICLRIKLAVTQLENRILLLLHHEYVSKRECALIRLKSPLRDDPGEEVGLCAPSEP